MRLMALVAAALCASGTAEAQPTSEELVVYGVMHERDAIPLEEPPSPFRYSDTHIMLFEPFDPHGESYWVRRELSAGINVDFTKFRAGRPLEGEDDPHMPGGYRARQPYDENPAAVGVVVRIGR